MEFLFHVDYVKVVEVEGEAENNLNAFIVLRKAQSVNALLLPPSRATMDMIAYDVFYNNNILSWLECKGV